MEPRWRLENFALNAGKSYKGMPRDDKDHFLHIHFHSMDGRMGHSFRIWSIFVLPVMDGFHGFVSLDGNIRSIADDRKFG